MNRRTAVQRYERQWNVGLSQITPRNHQGQPGLVAWYEQEQGYVSGYPNETSIRDPTRGVASFCWKIPATFLLRFNMVELWLGADQLRSPSEWRKI